MLEVEKRVKALGYHGIALGSAEGARGFMKSSGIKVRCLFKFNETDKRRIRDLNVVSTDKKAIWLIDYWCNKDVKGLIQMPLSRHWIMHVEASIRIKNKIKK